MRGSREEKRISENFEQVQKELRTSSKGAENKFKTCGEQVLFLEGEIPHMESRRHGVCEGIVLDITQG